MNEKTIKAINILSEKGIPFKLNMLEDGKCSILTTTPINELLADAGIIDSDMQPSKVYKEGVIPVSLGEMTNDEIEFEDSLPFPLCNDVAVMRRMNNLTACKVADIIGEAAYEATNALLSYLTECNAHIAYAAKETAVSEAKEEMCRIVDREENYNGDNECCSTSGGGHCKCHR